MMLSSAHDKDAELGDPSSLISPEMYWFQMLDAVSDDVLLTNVTVDALTDPPGWLKDVIKQTYTLNIRGVSQALLYGKLIHLADMCGFDAKADFKLSFWMKLATKETPWKLYRPAPLNRYKQRKWNYSGRPLIR